MDARLGARPAAPSRPAAPGVHRIASAVPGGATARAPHRSGDALLRVPRGHRPGAPAPLAVMLHGAGGSADHGLAILGDAADEAGVVVLAPASRGRTWDVIVGGFGPDVAAVDAALAETFARCAVDPARVALGGFSDGASYALSLGLSNGDLFTHVIALAPGFAAPARRVGAPRCFVAHGTRDAVLPIGPCSRRLVPALRRSGYDVDYREFDGPHAVPPEVARAAAAWLAGGGAVPPPAGTL